MIIDFVSMILGVLLCGLILTIYLVRDAMHRPGIKNSRH